MQALEGATSGFIQDADQIDRGVRTTQGRSNLFRPGHVAADRLQLADRAGGLQLPGEVGTAAGDAHPPAAFGQRLDHLAADETGAAEDGDKAGGDFVHDGLQWATVQGARASTRRGLDDGRSPRNAKAANPC